MKNESKKREALKVSAVRAAYLLTRIHEGDHRALENAKNVAEDLIKALRGVGVVRANIFN